MSPLASASAQVKSSPSLKIVEYDVFISRMPISRHTETIVESRMFAITMSTGSPRGGAGGRASSTGSLGCTIFRRMSLRPVAFSADHSTHHSEQNSAGLSCLSPLIPSAVYQHAAIVALDIFLDVVTVARKLHDALRGSVRSGVRIGSPAADFRTESTVSDWPGFRMVTEAASSTTAGPAMRWPARKASRRNTGVSSRPLGNITDRRPAGIASPTAFSRRLKVRLWRDRNDGRGEIHDLDDFAGNVEAEPRFVRLVEFRP